MTAQRSERVKKRPCALVTGGAVRVGRAIALALAGAGMDVAIGYHRSAVDARRTLRALEAAGARGVAVRADLADPAAARRLVGEAARALGGLDVLVNNAAVFFRTPFASTTRAQYDQLLDLNLRGAFFCAQAAARVMTNGGHIVNIADVGAVKRWPGYIPYTMSKAALVALTGSLAATLSSQRVAVNCVAPGAVLRPRGMSQARWQTVTRGRVGRLDDVTAAVVFFATCPFPVTGQVLYVDGGETG
jgi:NAD(P)-dependent dehydrogenase (short-subunit alcohol dehydrogenase family)